MGREITSTTMSGSFAPTVDISAKGEYVKGKVLKFRTLPKNKFGHTNPVVTLALIDLTGEVTASPGKGLKRVPVEVAAGAEVDVIGSGRDLQDKLPQLQIGDVVTITNDGTKDTGKGNPLKLFKVEVE